MVRLRDFEEAPIVETAMHCLWPWRCESTFVCGLVNRMGITGASLYNIFGDKRFLFWEILDCYL
jgi:TetR/AcrR family transcriptional repressor of nem operon